MKIRTVLALTDNDKDSLAGLQAGKTLAQRHGAEFIVGHVLIPRSLESRAQVEDFLKEHGYGDPMPRLELAVDADAGEGLDLLVEKVKPDLVTLSSKRRRGLARWFFGGASMGFVEDVMRPTLALMEETQLGDVKRVLYCVAGSAQRQDLIDAGATLAESGAEMHALTVIESAGLVVAGIEIGSRSDDEMAKAHEAADGMLAELKRDNADLNLSVHVEEGEAADTILDYVKKFEPDLIVMGTGAKKKTAVHILGSVNVGVVRAVDLPVLIVPTMKG